MTNAVAERRATNAVASGPGRIVRFILGSVLVTAAVAKAISPDHSAAGILSGWPLISQWLLIEAELVLGGLLLFGVLWRLGHHVALVVFAVFTAYAMTRVVAGEESCGCFGAVIVDPRITLTIDIVAVAALAATRPSWRFGVAGPPGRWALCGVAGIALSGFPLGIAMANTAPERGTGALASHGGFVLLEPEGWVGQRLPLIDVMDGGDALGEGKWTILLHHHGCHDCDRVRPHYEDRVRQGERVLLVETPPYAVHGRVGPGYSRLPADREWLVQTPVEIVSEDGIVVSIDHRSLRSSESRL